MEGKRRYGISRGQPGGGGGQMPTRVVARSSTPTTASTDTISLCGASLTTGQGPPLRRSSSI